MNDGTVATLSVLVFVALMANLALAVSMFFRYKKRALQHRERMAAIEKGAPLPPADDLVPQAPPWRPTVILRRGLMWTFSGVGMMIFLLGVSLSSPRSVPASERVTKAMYAKGLGATEEQIQQIMNEKEERGLPTGFCLIGLIPVGVGLAFLITYRKESAIA